MSQQMSGQSITSLISVSYRMIQLEKETQKQLRKIFWLQYSRSKLKLNLNLDSMIQANNHTTQKYLILLSAALSL